MYFVTIMLPVTCLTEVWDDIVTVGTTCCATFEPGVGGFGPVTSDFEADETSVVHVVLGYCHPAAESDGCAVGGGGTVLSVGGDWGIRESCKTHPSLEPCGCGVGCVSTDYRSGPVCEVGPMCRHSEMSIGTDVVEWSHCKLGPVETVGLTGVIGYPGRNCPHSCVSQ